MTETAKKTILVTGGAGFIGSHICAELVAEGYDVIIVDNFINSKESVIERLEKITGKRIPFYKVDIRDREALEKIFGEHAIEAVIHCAGLKSVGESVKDPLLYYDNNVYGSVVLLQVMAKHNVKKIVFSSSACVYGTEASVPYTETSSIKPVNPYGKSKLFVEEILRDLASSDPDWRVALLRYFNPIGAHSSGLIGEDPNGTPNNLLPYISQVATGLKPELLVFGNDYETPDGTGVRDYIHVVDLALGHTKALAWLDENTGVLTANLGTGKGVSVLELIEAFSRASGRPVPYQFVPRRAGDIASYYADISYAKKELGWHATHTIDEACEDVWRWLSSQKSY
ncbi:MAG: UDP-glucose-4-epimerase [Parcubacteria group bacterium GW2011_GWA1_44_13]|nr:MAG: UDP-glucose-4-epimerase [Candidatus Nomurabacteria bacterium GW2011_GWD1_44_10]KKT38371.1 MAG: UDP-glucose-4-epimerase [Parcubacteria group bacterium GW2011_GWA1_44_13]